MLTCCVNISLNCLNWRFVVRCYFPEIVHRTRPYVKAAIIGRVAPVTCAFDSRILAGQITEIILRSLEGNRVKVFEGREKMFGCIARVRAQLAKLKLLGQVARARIHRAARLHLWYFRVLVQSRVELAGQIDRVLDPWRIRLVRAVRDHVRDDVGTEGFRMNVR